MTEPIKFLTAEKMVGKTIAQVYLTGIGSTALLRFTDGTIGGFAASVNWEDEPEIDIATDAEDHELKAVGAIDEAEYARRMKERQRINSEAERAQYERLKAKYGV